jgi:hypothetical protein
MVLFLHSDQHIRTPNQLPPTILAAEVDVTLARICYAQIRSLRASIIQDWRQCPEHLAVHDSRRHESNLWVAVSRQ